MALMIDLTSVAGGDSDNNICEIKKKSRKHSESANLRQVAVLKS